MEATVEVSSVIFETAVEKLKTGLYESAINSFTDFLKEKPLNAQALQGRAQAYFQLNDWSQAEKNYALAKTLDPFDRENWMGLAASMAMQNRIFMAIEVYEELLAEHASYVPAHFQLGVLYFKLGAVGKARSYMSSALDHGPTPSQQQVIEFTLREQEEVEKNRYPRLNYENLINTPNNVGLNRWLRRMVQSVVGL